jgi:hypothetical protein
VVGEAEFAVDPFCSLYAVSDVDVPLTLSLPFFSFFLKTEPILFMISKFFEMCYRLCLEVIY